MVEVKKSKKGFIITFMMKGKKGIFTNLNRVFRNRTSAMNWIKKNPKPKNITNMKVQRREDFTKK